jgi:antitoxin (DNA-binding transcriptional repressor) of toxin-antitoxin stability system
METVNIHEAKTNLFRLVGEAAKGTSFIIAQAGKPMVKVFYPYRQKRGTVVESWDL